MIHLLDPLVTSADIRLAHAAAYPQHEFSLPSESPSGVNGLEIQEYVRQLDQFNARQGDSQADVVPTFPPMVQRPDSWKR